MRNINFGLLLLTGLLFRLPAQAQETPCIQGAVSLNEKIDCTGRAQEQYGIKKNKWNFGVVVYNDTYQIYRSRWLGRRGLEDLEEMLEKNDLPFPKTIIYMNKTGYKSLRDFDIRAFYGGDFALEEYELQEQYGYRFLHSFHYAYRTYLDENNPFQPKEDIDKMNRLNGRALKYFGGDPGDGIDGDTAAFRRVLEAVLDTANQPVLFHCWAGRHRTGMVGMALRYIQGGPHTRAIAGIPVPEDSDDKPFSVGNPAQLEYLYYTRGPGRAYGDNIRFMEAYSKTEAFRRFREHYRQGLNAQPGKDPAGEIP